MCFQLQRTFRYYTCILRTTVVLHDKNSCRNFHLTYILPTRAIIPLRDLSRKDSETTARSRNTNVRPMPRFDKSEHENGRLRVHLNRDTGICYYSARTSDQVFLVSPKGWRDGTGRGRREGRGRGELADPRDPESVDDACNHLVTAALCG